jgi:hypothetical protein
MQARSSAQSGFIRLCKYFSFTVGLIILLIVFHNRPNTLSWCSNNIEGVYKRGVIIGIVVGAGNVNGVVSSNIFLKSEDTKPVTARCSPICRCFCSVVLCSCGPHSSARTQRGGAAQGTTCMLARQRMRFGWQVTTGLISSTLCR